MSKLKQNLTVSKYFLTISEAREIIDIVRNASIDIGFEVNNVNNVSRESIVGSISPSLLSGRDHIDFELFIELSDIDRLTKSLNFKAGCKASMVMEFPDFISGVDSFMVKIDDTAVIGYIDNIVCNRRDGNYTEDCTDYTRDSVVSAMLRTVVSRDLFNVHEEST